MVFNTEKSKSCIYTKIKGSIEAAVGSNAGSILRGKPLKQHCPDHCTTSVRIGWIWNAMKNWQKRCTWYLVNDVIMIEILLWEEIGLGKHETLTLYRPLDMKGCICHFSKWQIHPFIFKGAMYWLIVGSSSATLVQHHINIRPMSHVYLVVMGVVWVRHSQHPHYVGPTSSQWWVSVVDGGPTLAQHRAGVLCPGKLERVWVNLGDTGTSN